MAKEYVHQEVEKKWRQKWEDEKLFQDTYNADKITKENKMYYLFAFNYPSSEGLHVGHVESLTALDISARYSRMNGRKVFFPVGWDAFGLPAENYAVKIGSKPQKTTYDAIKNYSNQVKSIGVSYDWGTNIATCEPEYYKWTQWLFLQMYNKGVAYKANGNVNWCPSCQTVLANEQVVDGLCERCDSEVEQRELPQWYFKITDYKDELVDDLDQVDWPESTKQQQKNWVGRSKGAEIEFDIFVDGKKQDSIKAFTTAYDTIYGVTFFVLAPEHKSLSKLTTMIENPEEVSKYVSASKKKTELERQQQGKEKTGIQLKGITAVNPANNKGLPVFVADYVLSSYGTGAVMGVPGHDKRDFQYAKKHNMDIVYLVDSVIDGEFISFTGEIKTDSDKYIMKNSEEFDGMTFSEARPKILEKLQKKKKGKAMTEYRLRDWLISRQRYWGTPIPIVYDPDGNPHPIKEEHLPWLLPEDVDFMPTGESPLTLSKEFHERTERLYGKGWKPEYDTMDTFVDSSWYYFRFTDPKNDEQFATKDQLEKWMPVDFYMIGPEHIVLHLLYSRFFTKFLRDEGYLNFDEPFLKMRHQGMILGPDHKKMSKSKGNVINPDIVINQFGADTIRMYEMFMGPIEADKPWDDRSVAGLHRFLSRVFKLVNNTSKVEAKESSLLVKKKLYKTIQDVENDIVALKFNTSIAKIMEFVNVWEKEEAVLSKEDTEKFVLMLSPYAPFLCEELYQNVIKSSSSCNAEFISVHVQLWPEYDESLLIQDTMTIVVQVNGKVRATLENISVDATEDEITVMARESVASYVDDKQEKNIIYVSGRLINIVVA